MPVVPKKAADRIVEGVKRFQPIVASAKSRDVNESDTVVIVTDMIAEIFGYDKYSEITSETAIRGTYCDLAVRIDGTIQVIFEVKAVGLTLKDQFVKQAVDYAANQGVDWVVLTNGETWRVYRVTFARPIDHELVFEFDVSKLNPRSTADIELLFTLSKEGWQKSALGDLHERKRALSRYCLGAILLSDSVLDVVRRELRRLSPNVRVEVDDVRDVLLQEVIKREVVEGEQAELARKKTRSALNRPLRVRRTVAATDGESELDCAAAMDAAESTEALSSASPDRPPTEDLG